MIDTKRYLGGYDANADADDYYFDPDRAAHAVNWIQQHCSHVKGPLGGKPLYLEIWQQALVGTLFGWYHKQSGLRRYRELFLYIPRKNGKSLLASAIALYVIENDDEKGYEAVFAASTSDQASLNYQNICGMINYNDTIRPKYKIYRSPKVIVPNNDPTSNFKVISSSADAAHGANLSLFLCDELHVQDNREFYDVLATSMGSRSQPLAIIMTTADYQRKSVCNQKYQYAKSVRDGTVKDPTTLPAIFEAPEKSDWRLIKNWKKANPNFGISITEEYAKKTIAQAESEPSLIPNLKRFHLNIQTGAVSSWLPYHHWKACKRTPVYEGPCYGGLDLASTSDLTAFVLWFPETNAVLAKHFIPEDALDSPANAHYLPWVERKEIIATEGSSTDYWTVRSTIAELHKQYDIQGIAFDPYNANEIASRLLNEDEIPTYSTPFNMRHISEAAKKLEVLVRNEQLVSDNQCLDWQASNVSCRRDTNDNILPSKKHCQPGQKIDGIAALCMCLSLEINSTETDDASVYEERGMIVL